MVCNECGSQIEHGKHCFGYNFLNNRRAVKCVVCCESHERRWKERLDWAFTQWEELHTGPEGRRKRVLL